MATQFFCDACGEEILGGQPWIVSDEENDEGYELCKSCRRCALDAAIEKIKWIREESNGGGKGEKAKE